MSFLSGTIISATKHLLWNEKTTAFPLPSGCCLLVYFYEIDRFSDDLQGFLVALRFEDAVAQIVEVCISALLSHKLTDLTKYPVDVTAVTTGVVFDNGLFILRGCPLSIRPRTGLL